MSPTFAFIVLEEYGAHPPMIHAVTLSRKTAGIVAWRKRKFRDTTLPGKAPWKKEKGRDAWTRPLGDFEKSDICIRIVSHPLV